MHNRRHEKIFGILCAVPKGDGFSVSAQRKADYLKKEKKELLKRLLIHFLAQLDVHEKEKN
jgi:hypothetical protein